MKNMKRTKKLLSLFAALAIGVSCTVTTAYAATDDVSVEGTTDAAAVEVPTGITPADLFQSYEMTLNVDNKCVSTTKSINTDVNGIKWVRGEGSITFYVNCAAGQEGEYQLTAVGGSIRFGTSNKAAVSVNGAEVLINQVYNNDGNNNADMEVADNTWGTIDLIEGTNSITISVSYWHKLAGIKLAGELYGVPAIDTVDNAGKTKITYQAEEAAATLDYVKDGKEQLIVVNCLTAGDYCFTSYYTRQFMDSNGINAVKVNGTLVGNLGNKCIPFGNNTVVYCKAVPVTVTLQKGRNEISFTPQNNQVAVDRFELTNYQIADLNRSHEKDGTTIIDGDTGNKMYFPDAGIEISEVLSSAPKYITKSTVYDTIPEAETVNIGALYVNNNNNDINLNQVIAAAYDQDGRLINVAMTPAGTYLGFGSPIQIKDFNISGASKIKLMAWNSLESMQPYGNAEFTK